MKRIAVLTSGGDAPGMNAAIRAVVRSGIGRGMEVLGVERGYNGLIIDDIQKMTLRSVADIIHRGGTILKTARCEPFKTVEGREKAYKVIEKHGIEGVVVIGGDGSFRGAKCISEHGIPTIGIPGTIDNDLPYTDFTLGFDTACNTVLDAINKLRDTMTSHDRISIIEVMGRNCGDLALYAGLAGGAEIVIVPEVPYNMDKICGIIKEGKRRGKTSSIIVLAEGAGLAEEFCDRITSGTGVETRATVLGHIQRGGSPTMFDRVLATRMGDHAVHLLEQNIGNRVIGIVDNHICDFDIMEALGRPSRFSMELYDLVNVMSQ